MSAPGLIILLTIALTASVSAILLQRRRHRARMATHTGALLELAGMHRSFATQQELAAVGSLTAPFAHTANNRLTVILSCLEMIGDTTTPSEDRLKAVALADEAARRLTTDMNALLAAARRQPAQLRIVELNSVIAQASNIFSHLPGPTIPVASRVPAGIAVQLDPERLQAAVLHLLSFARRRGAAMVALTGTEVVVETRTADRPMLRKGHYGCLDFELVGATVTDHLLRASRRAGNVTDRLLDPDGLELAAAESFMLTVRGQILVSDGPGSSAHITLYLPRAPAG